MQGSLYREVSVGSTLRQPLSLGSARAVDKGSHLAWDQLGLLIKAALAWGSP